ncbi:MAG: MATE family efflux transporter [Muribaculaceae bacterium]|nr:MATE family efflux transporter [Muribaculaceae bacterium]
MKKDDRLQKEIIKLTLPIAFQQFMLALVGASDAIMLGKLHQNAMSAVSLATQVTFVFNLFMAAFVIGENMFVAQYHGKKDYDGISRVFSLVLCISCVVATFFWVGTLLFPQHIMKFFTDEWALIVAGSEYLKVIGVSYLLSAIAQVLMTILKNCNAVNVSMIISSVTVIMNILLNALLIFGLSGMPAMGIRGAAWATVLSTAVQMVWCIVYTAIKIKVIRWRLPKRHSGFTGRFWSKTAPVLLNELAWGGGFTMYSVIIGHLGTDAVAANGIANITKNLMVCLCLGFGNAGSIIVGNRLGANRLEDARQAGKTLTRISIFSGILSGIFLLILSPAVIRLAGLTPQAAAYLRGMLIVCSYYLAGKSINSMTIGGIFPAGGDARFGLLCDAVTLWCITIPLGCLCAFVWDFPVLVVYFVLNLDEIVKLPVVYRHYKKYQWVKNLTNGGTQNE